VRDAVGGGRQVRVVPYSFELSAMALGNLKRLLGDVLGQKTTIQVDAPVAYGNEDQWLAANGSQLTGSDQLILLFSLSSTPEAENHGEMLSGLQRQLGGAVELFVLLDDSGFVHRHRGQASAPRRLEERLHAWRAVLAAGNVDPVRVTLDQEPNDDAARSLEQALLSGNAMQ
jgi:hypothetical protein